MKKKRKSIKKAENRKTKGETAANRYKETMRSIKQKLQIRKRRPKRNIRKIKKKKKREVEDKSQMKTNRKKNSRETGN